MNRRCTAQCGVGSDVNKWQNIKSVCLGAYVMYGLKEDGTVVRNKGNYYQEIYGTKLSEWKDVTMLDAHFSVLGLREDGTVYASTFTESEKRLVDEVETWTDIVQVAAGFDIAVGLKADGTVVWAISEDFEEFFDAASVQQMSDWTDIVKIAASHDKIIGLKSDGTLISTIMGNDEIANVSGVADMYANERHILVVYKDGSCDVIESEGASAASQMGPVAAANWHF